MKVVFMGTPDSVSYTHLVHRLTRSHDNQIGDPLPGVLLNPVNLVEHLRRSQAPHESADCGRAEAAAHPATDLG